MADEDTSSDDRTEEATPERRDEFRDRGQVVVSSDLTSVFVLGACVVAFTAGAPRFLLSLQRLFITHFEALATRRIDRGNILAFLGMAWTDVLWLIVPAFLVTLASSSGLTLLQTRMNWSWERLTPDFSRLNPWSGLGRLVNVRAWVEVMKNVAKMFTVSSVAYLILRSEWVKVPELMQYPIRSTWVYWGGIIKELYWGVAGFLLLIATADYIYNYMSTEKQMKMTRQEVKDDFKRRDGNPQVKAKMRRLQRDAARRKTIDKTRTATVLITNPTHYSIALRYEPGDKAPILVAKGIDFLALRMREVAKDERIPIIENRPLARELYATVKEGEEIPDKLYRVVAEIVRYVFKLKGRRLPTKKPTASAPPRAPSPAL